MSSQGGTSQQNKEKHEVVLKSLDEKYGNNSEVAKVVYNKMICHYAGASLTKDEKLKKFHPGLRMFEDLSAQYGAQVCTQVLFRLNKHLQRYSAGCPLGHAWSPCCHCRFH